MPAKRWVTSARLADCDVDVVCDPSLSWLHRRLDELFAGLVRGLAPARRIVLEVTHAAPGLRISSSGGTRTARDEDEALSVILSIINAEVLVASSLLTIHSGVVRARAGAIAWPAFSGAGKSTLVAAALQRGYQLVSDEALCLRTVSGEVVPYPKPVNLGQWAVEHLMLRPPGALVGETAWSAAELGSTAHQEPVELAAVVLLERGPNGTGSRLRVGRADQAMVALLRHSFNHWRMPDAAITTVHGVLASAAVLELNYDDPCEAVQLLSERFPPP